MFCDVTSNIALERTFECGTKPGYARTMLHRRMLLNQVLDSGRRYGTETMKGKCFCGTVCYDLLSEPEQVYYCHCRDCQILSGSAFHVLGVVNRDSLLLQSGELSEYTHTTDSGSKMTREFCTKCGTPLFLKSTRFPDIQMFTISALEQPEEFQPSFEIWAKSKNSWSEVSSEIESFKRGVPDREK